MDIHGQNSLSILHSVWVFTAYQLSVGLETSFPIPGAFQDGAGDGLWNYIGKVELSYLGKKDIWIDAIGQAFFSIGLCMGSIPALASYNPLNRSVTTDGKIICAR